MTDYWGAQAYWTSGGPNGFGVWYTPPADSTSVHFTQRPSSDGSTGTSIDVTHQQLMNSQPAHLSALADQWLNMYYLLLTISDAVWSKSYTLYTDMWKAGAARDKFMMTGPGSLLAYLDAWMDAALANQSALQALVSIVTDYQGKMTTLWTEYEQAIQGAQHLSSAETAWIWSNHYNLLGGNQDDYNSAIAQKKISQINDAKNQYNLKAQNLAWNMSREVFDTYSTLSGGHGPIYYPPNAVVDDPNIRISMPPAMTAPGGPGGAPVHFAPPPLPPPATAPAPTPPPGAPGGPPALAPPAPPGAPGSVPGAPGTTGAPGAPGSAPGAPASAPRLAPPAIDPAVAALAAVAALHASLPGGMPGGVPGGMPGGVPGGMPGGVPGGAPGVAPPPGALGGPGTGEGSAFAAPRLPGSGGLISRSGGDISAPGRMGGMGTPSLPPSAARGIRNLSRRSPGQPGEPESPGARSGRRTGARDGDGEVGSTRGDGLENPFGGQTSPSAPPVLNNKRRGRSTNPSAPRTPLSEEFGGGLGGRGDSVPPVLGRRTGKTARPSQPLIPGAPRIAADPTVTGAGSPVLRAPAPPLTGSAVSGLEEVPPSLRAPGAPQRGGPVSGRSRSTGPAELTNRNASRKKKAKGHDEVVEPTNLVTDEEAFSVETPGGGVLTGRPEESGYVAEAKAQVRAH